MADQALKSIPNKTLKEVHKVGKLACLLETSQGRTFFDLYLNDRPEFAKYWTFYTTAGNIEQSQSVEEQLQLAEDCYSRHVAIEASSEDRVDWVLNRSKVNKIKTEIASCRESNTSPKDVYKVLREDTL